jgi:cytochrome c553
VKKKTLIASVVLHCLTLSWACAPLLPYPTGEGLLRAQAEQPNITLQDLEKGRRLYAATCASCHTLHSPSERTTKSWEKVMVWMQMKARIDDSKRDSILAYLIAMDKKDRD